MWFTKNRLPEHNRNFSPQTEQFNLEDEKKKIYINILMYQDLKMNIFFQFIETHFVVTLHIKCLTESKNVLEKKIMLLQNKGHICVIL